MEKISTLKDRTWLPVSQNTPEQRSGCKNVDVADKILDYCDKVILR